MKTIKRYGFPNGDLKEDNDVKEMDVVIGRGVPKELIDTKERLRIERWLRFCGIMCLTWVIVMIVAFFYYLYIGSPEWMYEIGVIAAPIVASLAHLGFFFEAAASRTGKSYFALSVGLIWIIIVLGGIVGVFLYG